jgi:hypothetical protein
MDNNPLNLTDVRGLDPKGDGVKKHKTQSGDTYGKLAKKYNVSLEQLRKWNGYDDDKIPTGVELIVTDPAEVKQKNNETKPKQVQLAGADKILEGVEKNNPSLSPLIQDIATKTEGVVTALESGNEVPVIRDLTKGKLDKPISKASKVMSGIGTMITLLQVHKMVNEGNGDRAMSSIVSGSLGSVTSSKMPKGGAVGGFVVAMAFDYILNSKIDRDNDDYLRSFFYDALKNYDALVRYTDQGHNIKAYAGKSPNKPIYIVYASDDVKQSVLEITPTLYAIPKKDLEKTLGFKPKYVFITTEILENKNGTILFPILYKQKLND